MEQVRTLGARIAALRKTKGWTQEVLAEQMGVSPQAVSKWEHDLSYPDILMIPKLARAFGVTADALLSDEDPQPVTRRLPPEEQKSIDDMMLCIRADSADGDRMRITLPIPLIRVFMESGIEGTVGSMSFGKNGSLKIDWDTVMTLINSGVVGRLMECTSSDGDRMEIVVE